MDKWNSKVDEWTKYANSNGRKVEFEYWGSSELLHRLSQDRHAGRIYFWFNQQEFSNQWFIEKLERSVDDLGDRYTPELNFELEIAKAFDGISAVAHTHSEYATMFAQANKEIPCLGTTHADYFNGPIPVTCQIRKKEVETDYEANTGKLIIERFSDLDPHEMPAVLVAGHGPFTWGRTPDEAVKNSLVLEKVAQMAWGTLLLNQKCDPIPEYLLHKHHRRRHGPDAYYGQKKRSKE